MKNYVAFFDLDHTILSESSAKLYIKYMFQKGKLGLKEMITGIYVGIIYRLGVMDTEKIIKKWALKYTGKPEKEILDEVKIWFDEVVVNHFRKSILAEINCHKKNNGKVVILSAATNYICKVVQSHLTMDDTLCTELEVADGLFTGKLSGSYCFGEEKRVRAIKYCTDNNYSMENAFYYGDSLSDSYILEKVGNPVCVSPDWRLERVAEKQGWPVIKA